MSNKSKPTIKAYFIDAISVIASLIIFFGITYLLGRITATYIFYDLCIAGGKVVKLDNLQAGFSIGCAPIYRMSVTIGLGVFELIIILCAVKLVKYLNLYR